MATPRRNVLTNQETIQGAGHIGNGQMTLVNSGTINANGSAGMLIQANGGATSTGTIEATGGTLELLSMTVANTGGTISANGQTLQVINSTINGGAVTLTGAATLQLTNGVIHSGSTLTNSATGTIEALAGTNTLGGAINNSAGGTFKIDNGAVLNLETGTYSQLGNVQLNSSGSFTELVLQGNVTLSGGTVTMSNNGQNYIFGAATADTLTNQETISGSGHIGNGQLTLVNSGTINANGSAGMTIQVNGGVTNTGTIEATGGTLLLSSTTVGNTGGTISANGQTLQVINSTINGGAVTLTGAATLQLTNGVIHSGSTLTNSATGTIEALAGTNTLGGAINNSAGGTFKIDNGAVLNLETGTYSQLGNVQLNSSGSFTELVLQGNVTLSGGTVTMSNNGQNYIFGAATADTLTNQETISGSGHIGNGQLTLVNSGTINANQSAGMTIQVDGGVTNTGTMEATAGATLLFTNSGTITNTGGKILDNASTLQLITTTINGGAVTLTGAATLQMNNSTIQGATVTTSKTGIIESVGNNSIINASSVNFDNLGTLEAHGGTLTIEGPGTTFFTNDNQTTNTLTGGSYIANGNNIQWAAGSGGIKTLSANVTEENGGQLFNTTNSTNALVGLTSITSKGALTIGGVAFTDAGAFSNAGSLTILTGESFTVGSLAQIGGSTLTAGTYVLDANLNLSGATQNITTNSATLTLGGGTIENANSTNALAGLASNTKSLTLANNATFTTAGNFTNTGTLTINSGSAFTVTGTLAQISGSTLSGGTFVLGGNLNVGSGINITTNSSTLTLEGGTIMSGATNALAGLNKNTKSLTLANNANFTTTGNFTNSGTLTVNSGSTFAVAPGSSLTNYNSTTNTLTGGTYVVGGTLSASGLNIVTDAANITLNGTGELENSTSSTNALANLNTIAAAGSLTLASNANFTAAGNFTNSGKLTVNSGSTFGVTGTLTNLSAGTLTGGTYTIGGTMQLASGNGGITTNAANLTLTGTTAKIMDGASNALAGFNNNTGTFALSTGAKLTTAASNFTNSGTVTIGSGTTLTVGGTGNSYNQSAGTTTVDGTLVGGGTTGVSVTGGTMQGAGTLKTNVSLGGGTLNVGDANKAGLLKITGTYTQLASGTMNVSIGGTTVGTKYSQLQITGAASLGGALTAGLINSFTPTIGQTFTVLKAASITGTFRNSTIAINGSEHFIVSYTATTVVLTVASGAASSTAPGALQMAIANTKPASVVAKPPVVISGLRQRIGVPARSGKPIFVSGLYREAGHSKAMIGQAMIRPTWEGENLRVPHGLPVVSLWHPTSERPTPGVGDRRRPCNAAQPSVSNRWVGGNEVRVSPAPGLIGLSSTHRPAPPVRMLPTHIPIMATVR